MTILTENGATVFNFLTCQRPVTKEMLDDVLKTTWLRLIYEMRSTGWWNADTRTMHAAIIEAVGEMKRQVEN